LDSLWCIYNQIKVHCCVNVSVLASFSLYQLYNRNILKFLKVKLAKLDKSVSFRVIPSDNLVMHSHC